MTGLNEAQQRWQVVRSKGRTRGFIALGVVLVIVVAIALVAKSNAAIVVAGIILVVVVIAVVLGLVGKQRTGLSLNPEWKPEAETEYDDEQDADVQEAESPASAKPETEAEPVRRLDAQILGTDLSKLGQVVSPKLAKSYAVGTLVLEGPGLVWEPGASSKAAGIESLTFEPSQVSSVESVALWGSWALVRIASAAGDEWCLRVPGSVDLSAAFAELGLSLHKIAN